MESVCVIGAGGAGLAVAQALKARDVAFVVHEAGSGIGGNWRYDNDSGMGSAYASLRTNVSRQKTSLRNFPLRQGPTFLRHPEMLAYLESYADHFGLREHLRTRSVVVSAKQTSDGAWEVATDNGTPERHRAVIVATGYNSVPRHPELQGEFDGLQLHTHDYRTPEPFRGRDTVVIGLGCSAAELACEIAPVARSTTIAARSGNWVMSRRVAGIPLDWFDQRAMSRLPFALRRKIFDPVIRLSGTDLGRRLGAPTGRPLDKPWALSDHLVEELDSGRVRLVGAATELTSRGVRLADGRTLNADAILYATGYRAHYPYLDPSLDVPTLEHAPLYRGVAHPDASGLFFVGLVMTHGALLPVFEAQSAWVAEVLTGQIQLPSPEQMTESIAGDQRVRARDFDARWGILWDRYPYIRALEAEARRARRAPGVPAHAERSTLR
jgi:cation diffusion facilitator CzcD-associated flavoprotein CzcO